ncbi:hypothetical protein Rsub_00866 [Raphidocelis subcapitata]|uniref:Uncharacterized protein n=1 Tax=Raphidocelis subcapitata TaxID=307507 RepID=A0A2V0NL82_9CHLO|nr:hypothetical protein Rsub_00866 [Raphidocelis subcapitata]|eukprot:GBF88154.1 hypothetical protein Rsub_00866 [Raphidocelis subcapitata]
MAFDAGAEDWRAPRRRTVDAAVQLTLPAHKGASPPGGGSPRDQAQSQQHRRLAIALLVCAAAVALLTQVSASRSAIGDRYRGSAPIAPSAAAGSVKAGAGAAAGAAALTAAELLSRRGGGEGAAAVSAAALSAPAPAGAAAAAAGQGPGAEAEATPAASAAAIAPAGETPGVGTDAQVESGTKAAADAAAGVNAAADAPVAAAAAADAPAAATAAADAPAAAAAAAAADAPVAAAAAADAPVAAAAAADAPVAAAAAADAPAAAAAAADAPAAAAAAPAAGAAAADAPVAAAADADAPAAAAAAASGPGQQPAGDGAAAAQAPPPRLKHPLWWMAPFYSGSGYSTEAITYILSLLRTGFVAEEDLWISNHGTDPDPDIMAVMDPGDLADLRRAESRSEEQRGQRRAPVVVCHSMPYFYARPEPLWSSGSEQCPPNEGEYPFAFAIGRTMYETDGLPGGFAERCNKMDEIWVPSYWGRDALVAGGVEAAKVFVVPEGVNTTRFDPSLHAPLDLASKGTLVFGTPWADKARARAEAGARGSGFRERPFRFVSSFKWEPRKGWDLLLEAYLSEFTPGDDVELYILTKPYLQPSEEGFAADMLDWAKENIKAPSAAADAHSPAAAAATAPAPAPTAAADAPASLAAAAAAAPLRRLAGAGGGAGAGALIGPAAGEAAGFVRDWARSRPALARRDGPGGGRALLAGGDGAAGGGDGAAGGGKAASKLDPSRFPTLYVIDTHLPDVDYPGFYAAADAFVLPSRGEGWGRPFVEAASMGVPLIATNWSGQTAFLDSQIGYPIPIEGLVQATNQPEGIRWAQPSLPALRDIMRAASENPSEAAARGAAGRARMVERYSPRAVAGAVLGQLRRVEEKLKAAEAAKARAQAAERRARQQEEEGGKRAEAGAGGQGQP